MLDYILKNKEWIFSGIGVSTIALLFLCFKYFFRRNRSHTQNAADNTSNSESILEVSDGEFPQEDVYRIMKELEKMPPLHVDDMRRNYVGLKVDWLTEYFSAYEKDDDLIRVNLTLLTKSTRPINVNCEVKLSEYKKFSILKRGAKVRVVGEIAKFESYSFDLSKVMLFFHKRRLMLFITT